ncbi:hypothetical protein DL764_000666 [Monosporascus ibericus]|uniref:Protein kinase domain-containing protein n=1 Tax=Monosporascus ibericus TaxID=155417 RepID=A0A4Q4TXX3_9PEZI|nr:hypothetical protein DL764_000666 [Monosporascus ibericus]
MSQVNIATQQTESTQPFSDRTESTQPFSQQHGISLHSLCLPPAHPSETDGEWDTEQVRLAVMPTATGTQVDIRPSTGALEIAAALRPPPPETTTGVSWFTLPVADMAPVAVAAITQTAQAPGYEIDARLPPERSEIHCTVYFDPGQDQVYCFNKDEETPIHITCVGDGTSGGPEQPSVVYPLAGIDVAPGKDGPAVAVDLKVMPRRFFEVEATPVVPIGDDRKRRRAPEDSQASQTSAHDHKRGKEAQDEKHTIMRRRAREVGLVSPNPLLALRGGQSLNIRAADGGGQYSLTYRDHIAGNNSAQVFTASHSEAEIPGQLVVVKVLKVGKQNRLMHSAKMWLKETRIHSFLTKALSQREDTAIVSMISSDARLLTMYQAHVDAVSLASWPHWTETSTHKFTGTVADARHILADIAGAIASLHDVGVMHNDVKPANILYSAPDGRAVLIDFGLASLRHEEHQCLQAGTPWYLPPEFLSSKMREEPSDIFALGIVLLFALRLTGLPDALHRQWMIRHVHGVCRPEEKMRAVRQMSTWLAEVEKMRREIKRLAKEEDQDGHSELYRTVGEMLEPLPEARITAWDLAQRTQDWKR